MSEEGKNLQKLRILYVEDDEVEREIMARMMGHRLGRILSASDAKTALEIFEKERPDMVLTDIRMPGEDGLSLARKIRRISPKTPVVVISAHNENAYLQEALRIGVRDFLFKPVRVDELAQTLERVIAESRLAAHYDLLRMHNLDIEELGAMAQLYRYFKPLADASPLMIWVSDEMDNCIFANRGMLDFLGQPEGEVLGRKWVNFIHPDDLKNRKEISDRAAVGRNPFSAEYRLRRYDGTYRQVIDHAMPRFNDDRFEGFVGSCVDVTDVVPCDKAEG